MKRWILPLCVLLTLALGIAIAGDFWESKKFSAWSDEETMKMIENSPWAIKTTIKYTFPAPKGGGGRGGGGGMPMGGGGMPMGGGGGMPMGGGGGMPMGGGGGALMPLPPDFTPKATLRWQSALPVKQAFARARYKDAVETSEEAAKSLSREEAQYILGVIGLMGPPTAFDKEALKKGATLVVKDLPPIPATDVAVDKQGYGMNLYFAFPKLQEGAHKITESDGSVEFILKTENIALKGKFPLKKMVYKGKLEI